MKADHHEGVVFMAFCFNDDHIWIKDSAYAEMHCRKGIVNISRNQGLFISLIIHALIMVIPVSMAVVQKFDEIELFVMYEESPSVQEQKITRTENVQKTNRVFIQEKREIKEDKKVEEPQKVTEEKIIEPVAISHKTEDIPLSLEKANLPETLVREVTIAPAPQTFSSKETSDPHDVKFGTVTGPKFLHRELPVYPMIARRLGKEGKVVLRLTIDDKGNLLNVEVIENTGYGFTEAAIEAVKRSTFLPAKKDGKPIASRAILPVRFTLLENALPFRAGMKK